MSSKVRGLRRALALVLQFQPRPLVPLQLLVRLLQFVLLEVQPDHLRGRQTRGDSPGGAQASRWAAPPKGNGGMEGR